MKFRVWNCETKKYENLEDFKIDSTRFYIDHTGQLFSAWHLYGEDQISVFLDENILEYSSGLFDINGTEIYEGDIVLTQIGGILENIKELNSVMFTEGCFFIKEGFTLRAYTSLKIKGNIHQNPELLEN